MADVWQAFKFLNSALNLGMDDGGMGSRERALKEDVASEAVGPAVSGFSADNWEFFGDLQPKPVANKAAASSAHFITLGKAFQYLIDQEKADVQPSQLQELEAEFVRRFAGQNNHADAAENPGDWELLMHLQPSNESRRNANKLK